MLQWRLEYSLALSVRTVILTHDNGCNSLLYGTSASLIHSLQRTQNNLAKLVLLNPILNGSECLRQLHWLPIQLRIIFKISLITYHTLATSNPPYPTNSFTAAIFPTTFVHPPQFIFTNQSTDHPSSIEASPMPRLPSGTIFPPSVGLNRRSNSSSAS